MHEHRCRYIAPRWRWLVHHNWPANSARCLLIKEWREFGVNYGAFRSISRECPVHHPAPWILDSTDWWSSMCRPNRFIKAVLGERGGSRRGEALFWRRLNRLWLNNAPRATTCSLTPINEEWIEVLWALNATKRLCFTFESGVLVKENNARSSVYGRVW